MNTIALTIAVGIGWCQETPARSYELTEIHLALGTVTLAALWPCYKEENWSRGRSLVSAVAIVLSQQSAAIARHEGRGGPCR